MNDLAWLIMMVFVEWQIVLNYRNIKLIDCDYLPNVISLSSRNSKS